MSAIDDNYKQIGMRIKEARLKKKMSQQELGAAANVSLPHISEIERGKSRMQIATFVRIAEALQISTDVLLRPDIPEVHFIYQTEFQEILSDCSPAEIDSIMKIVQELKRTMRTNRED